MTQVANQEDSLSRDNDMEEELRQILLSDEDGIDLPSLEELTSTKEISDDRIRQKIDSTRQKSSKISANADGVPKKKKLKVILGGSSKKSVAPPGDKLKSDGHRSDKRESEKEEARRSPPTPAAVAKQDSTPPTAANADGINSSAGTVSRPCRSGGRGGKPPLSGDPNNLQHEKIDNNQGCAGKAKNISKDKSEDIPLQSAASGNTEEIQPAAPPPSPDSSEEKEVGNESAKDESSREISEETPVQADRSPLPKKTLEVPSKFSTPKPSPTLTYEEKEIGKVTAAIVRLDVHLRGTISSADYCQFRESMRRHFDDHQTRIQAEVYRAAKNLDKKSFHNLRGNLAKFLWTMGDSSDDSTEWMNGKRSAPEDRGFDLEVIH